MKRIIIYNIIIIILLLGSIEIATRSISFLSGKGFTLALHEVDPTDKKIKELYKWHPFVGFTFRPNMDFIGSHPLQKEKSALFVDKYGFLAKDNTISLTKDKDEIRIAAIGGSTTANINLSYDENWPGYLGNLLQKDFPDKKIRVINAGIPGFDTAQSIGNLALRVMPFKPDIVIIYHTYNDLKAVRAARKFKYDYSHIHTHPYGFRKEPHWFIKIMSNSMFYVRIRNLLREYKAKKLSFKTLKNSAERLSKIPVEAENAFREHIEIMVSIARSNGAHVILSSFATLYKPDLNWNNLQITLKDLSGFQRKNLLGLVHFTPKLTLPAIFDGFKNYSAILHDIAVQEKAIWVDNGRLIPHEDEYFVDRVHFSDVGAKKMAENFYPFVKDIIQK